MARLDSASRLIRRRHREPDPEPLADLEMDSPIAIPTRLTVSAPASAGSMRMSREAQAVSSLAAKELVDLGAASELARAKAAEAGEDFNPSLVDTQIV